MLIFRKIWCGFIRSIYSSTRLIQSNVAHCGKKLFFLCFPKWTYIQVLPLLCIAQNIDSTLYSKLEETGEWKSYYQGNDAIGFWFLPPRGVLPGIDFYSFVPRLLHIFFYGLQGNNWPGYYLND